jgi:hypothetical protein
MNNKTLYHGSSLVIEKPEYGKGNAHNDYGRGFYCTEDVELAKEWACVDRNGGYANIYTLATDGLNILSLTSEQYNILNWIAVLVNNRTFTISNQIADDARDYLTANFLPDISEYDAIIGYRADDSYFAFAQDFLNNTISLRQLSRAMALGTLGEQFVLKSPKAFDLLTFAGKEAADGEVYFSKRKKRDDGARTEYLKKERRTAQTTDDLYMIDILRQEMKNGDARLQGKLS